MLGKKEGENASLSQGTFIKELAKLLSKDVQKDEINLKNGIALEYLDEEKYPLRKYFINNNDDIILKILKNMFKAISIVFEVEWNDPDTYILSRTIGYGAIMKAFPDLFKKGLKVKKLDVEFFLEVFTNFSNELKARGKTLTSNDFPSNEQTVKKLADIIVESNY